MQSGRVTHDAVTTIVKRSVSIAKGSAEVRKSIPCTMCCDPFGSIVYVAKLFDDSNLKHSSRCSSVPRPRR